MILLVDNEPEILFLVTEYFKSHGEKIRATDSPEEALKLIREKRPKVVVTDIVMPELNGIKLSKMIRKEWPEIKIIWISGFHHKGLKDRQEIKADRYLEKPFQPKELQDCICELFPNT